MLYVVHVFQIYQYLNAVLGVSVCFHFESQFNKFLFLLFLQCGVFLLFVDFWWLMKNKISTSLLWKLIFTMGYKNKKAIAKFLAQFRLLSCISEKMSVKLQLQYKLRNLRKIEFWDVNSKFWGDKTFIFILWWERASIVHIFKQI